jgi:hypothetical protein
MNYYYHEKERLNMNYYYHEKERLNALFSSPNRLKTPVTFYLRDRSKVSLRPSELQILAGITNNDDKRIKALLSHKNIISAALMGIRENMQTINNNRKSRRKK